MVCICKLRVHAFGPIEDRRIQHVGVVTELDVGWNGPIRPVNSCSGNGCDGVPVDGRASFSRNARPARLLTLAIHRRERTRQLQPRQLPRSCDRREQAILRTAINCSRTTPGRGTSATTRASATLTRSSARRIRLTSTLTTDETDWTSRISSREHSWSSCRGASMVEQLHLPQRPGVSGLHVTVDIERRLERATSDLCEQRSSGVATPAARRALLARYPARQPNFFTWDMRIAKDFNFGERYQVRL